jgi:hypothetical protein
MRQDLITVWGSIRPLTRWYLDLLRNLLVVAAFSYVAAKSQNKFVDAIARFSQAVLSIHCMTYILPALGYIPSMQFIASSRWRRLIYAAIFALGWGLLYYGFTQFFNLLMSQLVQSQAFR